VADDGTLDEGRVTHRLRSASRVICAAVAGRARRRPRLIDQIYAIQYTITCTIYHHPVPEWRAAPCLTGRMHVASSNSRLSLGTQSPG
jgi:hypothetical protein